AVAAQPSQRRPFEGQHILACEQHLAAVHPACGPLVTEQVIGDRRFAAAGFADEAESLAAGDGKAHAIDHAQPSVIMPIRHAEIANLDDRRCSHRWPICTLRPRIRAKPSVNRLRPTTSEARASPGPRTVMGVTMISALFSLMSRPHSGIGGLMPKPRKP